MDFELPEHVAMLRDSLRRFVDAEMPRAAAAEWDSSNTFPRAAFARLAQLGVMGLTVPEAYGGTGRDIVATMVVIEELSRRSLAVAIPYIMATCYAGMNLVDCGSETQKETLLPRVAAGELLFAYGWTEPDVGADLASVKTTAIADGGQLLLRGAKRFCSGAGIADYIYVLAVTAPGAARYHNLSLLLVPADADGVRIEPIAAMGAKGAGTTDVVFDRVRVPLDNVMGGPGGLHRGWQMITGTGLDVEKLEVAAMALGIAGAAFDDAWRYSRERVQFGKAVSNYQSIRHKLAQMKAQLQAARLMLMHAAWLADGQQPCGVETSMCKLFVTETAKSVVLEAQTIFGAYGYVKGYDIERYVRDILLMPIIGGSSAVQLNNIAKWSGLDRS